MMASEEKAKRIAAALERLAAAYEQETKVLEQEPLQGMCFRCFPPHRMDWHNPCEKYQ